ncbi:MAG TPA: hypothetical protein VD859_09175 [Nocardioides sp.]|nr:hypothetical protein [Nocardioides sp.]
MTSLIHLHIGAMKTGTTFLQQLMDANRDAMRDAGYLFPGERWRDQVLAVRDIMGELRGREPAPDTIGRWEAVRDEMLGHDGPSVLSMEFLSFCSREKADAILETLRPAEVRVVLTVRDFGRALPAQWQTRCRVNGTVPWPKFARGVARAVDAGEGGGPAGRVFRRAQDIPRMLDAWVPPLGPDRVTVITVPPSGADPMLLWDRFAQAVGLDPATCRPAEVTRNTSLGHPSAELLRRIHAELDASVDDKLALKRPLVTVVQDHLARDLEQRARLETPVRMDRRAFELAARWNGTIREALVGSGVRVIGSLDELPVDVPDDAPRKVHQPTDEQLLDAAGAARESLQRLAADLGIEPPAPAGGTDGHEAVAAAVRELTVLVAACTAAVGPAR